MENVKLLENAKLENCLCSYLMPATTREATGDTSDPTNVMDLKLVA